jgi:hypothetical protein
LKTIAWIHGVRRAAIYQDGLSSNIRFGGLETALAKNYKSLGFLADSKIINRYARGQRTPQTVKLKLFEQVFPGTREIFENGPDASHLWRAISCADSESAREAFSFIKSDIQNGIDAEKRVVNAPIPGVQDLVIPVSVARRLKLSTTDLELRNKQLEDRVSRNPDLWHSLPAMIGGGPFAHYAEGPLVDLNSDVTFSPDERLRSRISVTPSVLTGFSMQLLQARVSGERGQPLELRRQLEIERRLQAFGLSLDDVARVTGFGFYRFDVQVVKANCVMDTARGDSAQAAPPGGRMIRWELSPHTVKVPRADGGCDEIPGPTAKELRVWPSTDPRSRSG